jgi:hypothetical protein
MTAASATTTAPITAPMTMPTADRLPTAPVRAMSARRCSRFVCGSAAPSAAAPSSSMLPPSMPLRSRRVTASRAPSTVG